MNKRTFGIDVDGVLANFLRGFAWLTYQKYSIVLPVHDPAWPSSWDWHGPHMSNEQNEAVWQMIEESDTFWRNLPPVNATVTTGLRILSARQSEQDDVYFMTHRMGLRAKHQTENWLHIYGFDDPTVLLVESKDKAAVARALKIDVYIDDKDETVVDVATTLRDCRVYMNVAPYNVCRGRDCTEPWQPHPHLPNLTAVKDFAHMCEIEAQYGVE